MLRTYGPIPADEWCEKWGARRLPISCVTGYEYDNFPRCRAVYVARHLAKGSDPALTRTFPVHEAALVVLALSVFFAR